MNNDLNYQGFKYFILATLDTKKAILYFCEVSLNRQFSIFNNPFTTFQKIYTYPYTLIEFV